MKSHEDIETWRQKDIHTYRERDRQTYIYTDRKQTEIQKNNLSLGYHTAHTAVAETAKAQVCVVTTGLQRCDWREEPAKGGSRENNDDEEDKSGTTAARERRTGTKKQKGR